ncbi:MAG: carbohydrate ABC transporter permease [Spirochaetales bacterium]|nr:carbohydrate ABC transporter permease [Spirochaetales bacterium]
MTKRKVLGGISQILVFLIFIFIFVVPLVFIFLNAGMDVQQASRQRFELPENPQFLANFTDVFSASDNMLLRAFKNSILITVLSIVFIIITASMASFVLERRKSRVVNTATSLILAGLMIPPSVVTTIWLLKGLGLYKTLPGIILIEVALNLPFAIVLYRGFMITLPRELDEAAIIDGCSPFRLFTEIILPLLQPVSVSVIVLSSVGIFNDFVNPLYFLPGAKNVTVQLTLYNFIARYSTQWNLLFMNVLIISIPPLLGFIFFNKKIIGGMVAGAVKG